ncbi:MAG: tRNA (adenosine(37)-N6)-dimethylallyltransferase MiaA [Saprospiraceae bacterium]
MGKATKYLIVVGGATATGKTNLSIQLARHFGAEIISADSRQFYREMNIGTAKPSPEELEMAPHHFINSLSVEQDYSVGDFEKDALALLRSLFEKSDVAILVGGSGLFIQALCEGMDEFPEIPSETVAEVAEFYKEKGLEGLQKELEKRDPDYFLKVDRNNPQRLMRAISVCRATGAPFSSFLQQGKRERPFQPIYILLEFDRELLYKRINQRVDDMMEAGLLEEAKNLFPKKQLNALQTVGYQELFDFLDGKKSLPEAVELIKRNTRRYAKRQMTWFRKYGQWQRFNPTDTAAIVDFINHEISR